MWSVRYTEKGDRAMVLLRGKQTIVPEWTAVGGVATSVLGVVRGHFRLVDVIATTLSRVRDDGR